MPLFRYRATDLSGRIHIGETQQNERGQALDYVKSLGLLPIEVSEQKASAGRYFELENFNAFHKQSMLSKKEVSIFARQMFFVSEAGLPIGEGIGLMRESGMVNKKSRLAKILPDVHNAVLKGHSLWSAFDNSQAFPKFFIHMTLVAEQSGQLKPVMQRLADYYEKEGRISEELKSAMLYPSLVTVMMLGVIVTAMIYVVPSYTKMFAAAGASLPVATAALISISGFLRDYGQVFFPVLSLAAAVIYYYLGTKNGSYLKHRLFLFSKVYVKTLNLRFAQSASLLLESGTDLVLTLQISKNVMNNRVMDGVMDYATDNIRRGMSLYNALSGSLYFEPTLLSLIKVGEETGNLPVAIDKCSSYLASETEAMIFRLNKLVEPVITLVLGAILAFIMLALMLPTFYMSNIM